ncbi:MAG: NTP transferase domain-containing protein [Betaproteobacteria bacterium]|nr:NTP transferase domain-containing protein [Betaproteobacteria bacterium]
MDTRKVLVLVLAGGEGIRLYPLTSNLAKPAVPFVDGYRLIDFVLSNLVNSRISTIYVLAQYQSQSLIEHLDAAWAPWSRGTGLSIKVRLPRANGGVASYKGTADAVYQNIDLIERHKPDFVAVFAADHVYRMDIRQMVSFHWARNAEVSVAAVPVPIEEASSFGIIVAGADGCIQEFQEKPDHPAPMPKDPARAYASMGNYLFNPRTLVELLEETSQLDGTDFGRHILPRLPRSRRVLAYNFAGNEVPGVLPHEERGYWRDVGTLDALRAAQFDVMGPYPRFDLRNRRWPIHGVGHGLSAVLNRARLREEIATGGLMRHTVLPPPERAGTSRVSH